MGILCCLFLCCKVVKEVRAQGGSMCPRLPFGWCPRLWDEAHVPGAEEDDVAIYGEALARRKHWPLWMLLVRDPPASLKRYLNPKHLVFYDAACAHKQCTSSGCTSVYVLVDEFMSPKSTLICVCKPRMSLAHLGSGPGRSAGGAVAGSIWRSAQQWLQLGKA